MGRGEAAAVRTQASFASPGTSTQGPGVEAALGPARANPKGARVAAGSLFARPAAEHRGPEKASRLRGA